MRRAKSPFRIWLVLLGIWLARASAHAQSEFPAITNLAQLQNRAYDQQSGVYSLQLSGVVCAVNFQASALLLDDGTAAELIRLNPMPTNLEPGARVRIAAPAITLAQTTTGLGQTPNVGWAYDSYAKSQNYGGTPETDYAGCGETYTKTAAITAPSLTFTMVEHADFRGYNVGTWVVTWNKFVGRFQWDDTVAMYHGNINTFGFADGHAEYHKWKDAEIIKAGLKAASGQNANNDMASKAAKTGSDYDYVHDRYRFGPGWK